MIVDNPDDWEKVREYAKEIAGKVAAGTLEGSAIKELTANWLRSECPKPEATPGKDKKKAKIKQPPSSTAAIEKAAVSTENVVDDKKKHPVAKEKASARKKASAGKKRSSTSTKRDAAHMDDKVSTSSKRVAAAEVEGISEPEDFYVVPNMTAGFAVQNCVPER